MFKIVKRKNEMYIALVFSNVQCKLVSGLTERKPLIVKERMRGSYWDGLIVGGDISNNMTIYIYIYKEFSGS